MGSKWVKIAQNRPKIGVSGQNMHCQNTAGRKLRPNARRGAADAILLRPLGRRVPNLATKRPKGPICCQIWNGFRSIASVFGSSVPPNACCVSKNGLKSAQNRPKGPKVGSKWLKLGQKWPRMTQNNSKWLKMAQNRPKLAQSRVKMAQIGSKWPKWLNGPN